MDENIKLDAAIASDSASTEPKKTKLSIKRPIKPVVEAPAAQEVEEEKPIAIKKRTNHFEEKEMVKRETHEEEQVLQDESDITFFLKDLKKKSIQDLILLAESLGVENPSYLARHDLIFVLLKHIADRGGVMIGEGVIEIVNEGYGFLRAPESSYTPAQDDIYVGHHLIKRMGLRTGDVITGPVRAPKKGERYFALVKVNSVNGSEDANSLHRVHFDDLTPIFPNDRIILETSEHTKLGPRIIDIVTPQGKGQRTLSVAPPRTGKTMLLQSIAHSITTNHPEVKLIALLVDERPEEMTDMKRSIKGEVVHSTFDEPSTRHVQLAELVIEKAKRLVEQKHDVVILLDSITRLARAYNNVIPSSGKVLSGGVDSNALQRPKRIFGAARNIEEGGSLTIIGTALVETGSRMDEVIFEEFKGTGNSEIILDRKVADKRVFPAIDITKSGTRKEDLLLDKSTLTKMWVLRRIINPMGTVDAIEFLIDKLNDTKSNAAFFDKMNSN